MLTKEPSKKATARTYSPEEKERAVRLVRTLREELGEDRGCAKRVADQLGYGVESVRSWVRQADIDDGYIGGVTTDEAAGEPRPMTSPRHPGGDDPVVPARHPG